LNLIDPARRALRHALLACALVAAAGCTTISTAPDPLKTPPKANESVAVVSITGNTAQVTAMDVVSVTRLNADGSSGNSIFNLTQVAPGLARDTSLFVGVLPAGAYEFSGLSNSATNQVLRMTPTMRQRIGRFTIVPGTPTDLGRLVMTPVNTSVVVGRSSTITTNLPMMQRFVPLQAQRFAGTTPGGWDGMRTSNDRVEEYARLRPVGADNMIELSDGRVVAASRLGSLLIRSTEGYWRVLPSTGLESLLHVTPVDRPDASLVAAGEFGTLLRLPPGGDRLVPIDTGDLPPGNLLFVDGNDRTGWYIAEQSGTEVTLFKSPRLVAGTWTPVRKESVANSFWSGFNSLWIWRTPQGLAYALSSGQIHWLDYASGAWRSQAAPNGSRIVMIEVNPTGSLGLLTSPGGGFAGVFASLYLSKDQGATWKEIKSDFNVKVAPPYETLGGALLNPGGVFSDRELHASDDGGKTWKKRSPFALENRLVLLPSGKTFAVDRGLHGLFSVQSSADEGATWKTEYSNFDAKAFEAVQKK
jgi:hypothetical protein